MTVAKDLALLSDTAGNNIGRLDYETGRLYDMNGKYERTLESRGTDHYSDDDVLASLGMRDPVQLDAALSFHAASGDVAKRGKALGKKLQLKSGGRRGDTVCMGDLAIGDVHIPSAMPNVALGYHLEDGVADIALPVVPSAKQSDKFFTWNSDNAFKPVAVNMGAAGGAPNEISPAISNTLFSAAEYALASYVPTEIEANTDAPLAPYQAAVDMVLTKLRMAREMRVASLLTTSGNWNANNVLALVAGQQWNGGASTDPIANIHFIEERSYQKISRIVMGGPVFHALQRNQAVRAYHYAKTNDPALPNAQELSRILELPPIIVAEMKYTNAAGSPTYVWPSAAGSASSVVLLHEPSQNPPSNGRENASGYTFRWTGASAPDGTATGGFMVRSYYDPRRGGRGGRVVVVLHNDAEVLTGPILGGLITNCVQ
jgi:hypothetical protein